MNLEEAKNLLIEMRDNCLKDGKYNDPKRKDKAEAIETVLQELDRLQKENGKLTRARKWFVEHTVGQIATPEMLRKILADEYIHKDKIREKIEEIKARMNDDCLALHEFQRIAKIDVLQDLLKEE